MGIASLLFQRTFEFGETDETTLTGPVTMVEDEYRFIVSNYVFPFGKKALRGK